MATYDSVSPYYLTGYSQFFLDVMVNRPTYVPTKIELSFTLLPIQSRGQVSKQFSLENFANGNLIKGGFW